MPLHTTAMPSPSVPSHYTPRPYCSKSVTSGQYLFPPLFPPLALKDEGHVENRPNGRRSIPNSRDISLSRLPQLFCLQKPHRPTQNLHVPLAQTPQPQHSDPIQYRRFSRDANMPPSTAS